jgi:hypothetical protein
MMIDKKKLENADYFNYMGNTLTRNEKSTNKIKSRTAVAIATFNKKKNFHRKIVLKCKEGIIKVLHLGRSFVWCCNLDASEISSEITWMFVMWYWRWMEVRWNERDINEGVWGRVKEERTILHTIKWRADWTGGVLSRNCLLRHVTDRKIRVLEWRERKRKQLLDDLKATKR